MKWIVISLLSIIFAACHNLDLNPLSNASTENWYSNEMEVEMAVNDLYGISFWPLDAMGTTSDWADDEVYRESLTPFQNATLNAQTSTVTNLWFTLYKKISHANGIILNAHRAIEMGAPEHKINNLIAEARFCRACAYADLSSKFGDVPFVNKEISIDEAMKMGRVPLPTIKQFVYDEFDAVADVLPVQYSGIQRATSGAALAMKARYALYMGDYNVVVAATKAVMDLGVYSLHKSYGDLFLPQTKNAEETIFKIPRSIEYNVVLDVHSQLPRNFRGFAGPNPTWDLLAAYVCTDGLPIDRSPLFDSHNPFKNRDPRLAETIVPFGENFLGIEYNPHPEALQVMDFRTGKMIQNNDTRAVSPYASYTGLIWKKGIDNESLENSNKIDPDMIIIRYADILLMYAEAKIELNLIDQSVVDAMNEVRARAYGVDKSAINLYPAFTLSTQNVLRTQLRMERRVEFVKEGLRYMDLMRWKLMDKVMSKKVYIMLYPVPLLMEKVVNQGDWFWPFAPDIDENGLADFTKLETAGKINSVSEKKWDDRQYLWPIPEKEILINSNMKQNPGY